MGDAGLTDGDHAPPDGEMAADPHLPAEHDVVANLRAPRDADLRGHQHVAPDDDAVGDLHEVVDLRARLDARLADGGTIDGGVGAELDVVFDDDCRDLGDLLVRAVAAADEAVPVAADDDAVLQHDAIANGHALANRDVRVDDAVGADPRAGADGDVGKDDRTVANDRSFTNRHERADGDAIADARVARDRRHRVDARLRLPSRREDADGAGERQVRIRRAQHRATRRLRGAGRIVAQQHGGGARRRQRRQVLGIGDEGEIARARILDAGDAHDLDLAVAFEAAGEPFSKVPQLHRGMSRSISDGPPEGGHYGAGVSGFPPSRLAALWWTSSRTYACRTATRSKNVDRCCSRSRAAISCTRRSRASPSSDAAARRSVNGSHDRPVHLMRCSP